MIEVNLISIIQATAGLDRPLYNSYFNLLGIEPNLEELKDLESFLEQLMLINQNAALLDRYFLNYSIPQIGKEFDLLRFGHDYVVNIELKRESTEDKITKQLIRNHYYLSFLGKPILNYTYVSSEKQLYSLTTEGTLVKSNISLLSSVLQKQECQEIHDIDTLFNPSNYLVSPFNSTKRFVDGEYFLTVQQETIKNEFLNAMKSGGNHFISIYGKAGTGKTLLTYDIAKNAMEVGSRTLIIHCGKLNQGHFELENQHKWDIISIKNLEKRDLKDYSLVIVDEVQRIYPTQLIRIIDQVRNASGFCIFSYDSRQCLRAWETGNNIEQQIEDRASPDKYELTKKIRTNKEIALFIVGLFDKSKEVKKARRTNVLLSYFQEPEEAKKFLRYQGQNDWKIINYTPSSVHTHPYEQYNIFLEENAHQVIGQEFDKVVAVIDPYFSYKENKLTIHGYKNRPYYDPVMMLFQAVTRTRRKLCIVVINNPEVMERCLCLLD